MIISLYKNKPGKELFIRFDLKDKDANYMILATEEITDNPYSFSLKLADIESNELLSWLRIKGN